MACCRYYLDIPLSSNVPRFLRRKIMSTNEKTHHHIMPLSTNIAVFVCLLCLTVCTILLADFDFGRFNLAVAMTVATTKAALVVLYFMHLKYDNNINRFIFGIGFLFLLLFYGICAIDLWTR